MLGFRTSLTALLFLVAAGHASAIIIDGGKGHALLPLSSGQVGRIYAANLDEPGEGSLTCGIIIHSFAADGSVIGDPRILEVPPGTSQFVDYFDRTLVLGGRRTIRVVVELNPKLPADHCVVQEMVFDLATGRTQLMGDPKVLPRAADPPEPE